VLKTRGKRQMSGEGGVLKKKGNRSLGQQQGKKRAEVGHLTLGGESFKKMGLGVRGKKGGGRRARGSKKQGA